MSGEPLQAGDWVRTDSGLIGKIVLVVRLTAYVDIQQHDAMYTAAYLLSELVKIDEPTSGDGGP
jgi:preprotein translocase subunit YajC